ncbi:MAG TPA: hypothetical protein PKK11_00270 [Methanothrix sp.]|nr:hypothetical protein [Methanothrix sp.]HPT18814.1 hypothetical protein [Methanothrix sp.]
MNKIFGGISIKSIKLILSILALGILVAVGAAYDDHGGDHGGYGDHGGDYGGYGDHDGMGDHSGRGGHDTFDGRAGGKYIDWLNPGGYYYYTSWYYPTYSYSWYPAYTYNYPAYYYTEPVVYPTYYYDPVVYDPWYATNVYGWGGATYYYTNSWTWSNHGGFFF